MNQDHLLQRVWGAEKPGGLRTLPTHLMRLRYKLGEDADSPKYIFSKPRAGYRMLEGETRGQQKIVEFRREVPVNEMCLREGIKLHAGFYGPRRSWRSGRSLAFHG